MQGLEISRQYWEQYGKPAIEKSFPELLGLIAAGLIGPGSECFGLDDEISRDHDFEPGFCIFLPDEKMIDRRNEFLLERVYSSLPDEFMGLKRNALNPAGGNRHGVFRTEEYLKRATGIKGSPDTWRDWLSVPDYALSEITNGEIFFDGLGEFSAIRNCWQNPPDDIKNKKICGFLLSMSQTGEYNYNRCIDRGDSPAAVLSAVEFVKACCSAFFWIHGKAAPYYKLMLRAMRKLPGSESLYILLCNILSGENTRESIDEAIKTILSSAEADGMDLQRAAIEFNLRIADAELRNLSLLAAI